jgi:nucleoside-diphosphate-sugar epimerase
VDITDRAAVDGTLRRLRPEFVFHLAGLSSARGDRDLVMETLQVNLVGTLNVLLSLAEVGCERVALACSAEEVRGAPVEQAVASPYGAAKTAASLYGRLFHRSYGVPVVLVRPILAYGPRQQSSKIIPYVAIATIRGEVPRLGNCARLCDFVFVTDVVRGFLCAALAPGVQGQTIDLGSGDAVPLRTAVEQTMALAGGSVAADFGARPDRIEDPMKPADREATRRLLGWDPLWSLEAGLRDTVDWYRAHIDDIVPTTGAGQPR